MPTYIPIKEATGKTIRAVFYDDQLVLAFTDGTVSCLGIDYNYGDSTSIADDELELRYIVEQNDIKEYVAAGVFTQAEVDAVLKEKADKKDRQRRAEEVEERQRYEKLKAKYG